MKKVNSYTYLILQTEPDGKMKNGENNHTQEMYYDAVEGNELCDFIAIKYKQRQP